MSKTWTVILTDAEDALVMRYGSITAALKELARLQAIEKMLNDAHARGDTITVSGDNDYNRQFG